VDKGGGGFAKRPQYGQTVKQWERKSDKHAPPTTPTPRKNVNQEGAESSPDGGKKKAIAKATKEESAGFRAGSTSNTGGDTNPANENGSRTARGERKGNQQRKKKGNFAYALAGGSRGGGHGEKQHQGKKEKSRPQRGKDPSVGIAGVTNGAG